VSRSNHIYFLVKSDLLLPNLIFLPHIELLLLGTLAELATKGTYRSLEKGVNTPRDMRYTYPMENVARGLRYPRFLEFGEIGTGGNCIHY
jgi:hypothetical protein